MNQNKQIRFELSDELFENIKNKCADGKMSEFIRMAINNELNADRDYAKEFRKINGNIKNIEADSLHKALGELIVTTQVIFEELRRQNEILKLLHRRSTFSSLFSKHGLDAIKNSDDLSKSVQLKAVELIQDELKQLKF